MFFSRIAINLFLSIGLVCSLIGCDPVSKSASQAFDNANSVIKSGSDVLFMDPEATPTKATTSADDQIKSKQN